MTLHRAYLALGTNLGDRPANMRRALDLLGQQVGTVERCSSWMETEPQGFSSPHPFLNAVCLVATTLSPLQLLAATEDIERQMGRTTKSRDGIYHDRIIDIDILLYDDLHLSSPTLTIPHPRMQLRSFVMKPLREILAFCVLVLSLIACEQGYVAPSEGGASGSEGSEGSDGSNGSNVTLCVGRTPTTSQRMVLWAAGEKVETVDQDSLADDYGCYNLSLPQGSYHYIVVGYDTPLKPTISTTEVTFRQDGSLRAGNTYAASGTLEVGDTTVVQQATLGHVSARLRLMWEGTFPLEAATIKYYYTGGSSTLSPTTWKGSKQSRQTVVLPLTDHGSTELTDDVIHDLYTFPHTATDTLCLRVTLLDTAGATLSEFEMADLPVATGCTTVFAGGFFDDYGYLYDPIPDSSTDPDPDDPDDPDPDTDTDGDWGEPYIINL